MKEHLKRLGIGLGIIASAVILVGSAICVIVHHPVTTLTIALLGSAYALGFVIRTEL